METVSGKRLCVLETPTRWHDGGSGLAPSLPASLHFFFLLSFLFSFSFSPLSPSLPFHHIIVSNGRRDRGNKKGKASEELTWHWEMGRKQPRALSGSRAPVWWPRRWHWDHTEAVAWLPHKCHACIGQDSLLSRYPCEAMDAFADRVVVSVSQYPCASNLHVVHLTLPRCINCISTEWDKRWKQKFWATAHGSLQRGAARPTGETMWRCVSDLWGHKRHQGSC